MYNLCLYNLSHTTLKLLTSVHTTTSDVILVSLVDSYISSLCDGVLVGEAI